MIKLAESSGTAIYEEGSKLYISKRPAGWTPTFLFVTALLAFILLANGILQSFVFNDSSSYSTRLGVIFILAGLLFVFIAWKTWSYRKKLAAIPPSLLQHTAIIDFAANTLLDGGQHILAPLSQAYLQRKFQLSSSSPELVLLWPGGSLSIVKGNPFAGGITAIENVLLSKGIRKGWYRYPIIEPHSKIGA